MFDKAGVGSRFFAVERCDWVIGKRAGSYLEDLGVWKHGRLSWWEVQE
jgi:hypothetical protein